MAQPLINTIFCGPSINLFFSLFSIFFFTLFSPLCIPFVPRPLTIFLFKVLQKAADRALARMHHSTWVGNIPVRITRTVSNPYTLVLNPTKGRYRDTIEIDMVPAFEIPIDLLPKKTKRRVREVEERVGVEVENCLAVALPVVNTKQLQVDFPQLARKMMANKPSLKAAIRMFKHERDIKGGPFTKIWSYAVKNAGLWEVYKFPADKWWSLVNLEDRYFGIRYSLANSLINDELKDIFFPNLNLMKRIKCSMVKKGAGNYLQKTNPEFEELFCCPEVSCRSVFVSDRSATQHYNDKHIRNGHCY